MRFNSKFWSPFAASILLLSVSCSNEKNVEEEVNTTFTGGKDEIKLITLDPGHFHAHLVVKSMYDQVDPKIFVYAPDGPELTSYLKSVESYNTREEDPTSWELEVYKGDDYLQKMLSEKKGNVMLTAGNNKEKTANIKATIEAGINVLADKPMAIDAAGFETLKEAFELAEKNDVLLFDIMTERFEISTILQREFSLIPEVFGQMEKGTVENPAITKESIHHFYKQVAGKPLTRPGWFYDVNQQGNGIVDVTTHLVDLVQWESFPGKVINYETDIEMINAKRWTTDLTLEEFTSSTGLKEFPDYLQPVVSDGLLKVYGNGEINYKINGVHAKVSVIWNYKAPEGSADTHYSIMRGTKANLVIRQDAEEKYKPELYIEPVEGQDLAEFEENVTKQVKVLAATFKDLDVVKVEGKNSWRIIIPQAYRHGHEDHFREVTETYIKYLKEGKLPDWEVPNMLAKYYVTTQALELAK
ncbi:putative oxidoreductase C-terminal domain-containing protein [uncultured Cyclobacterium sp.]|uniref:putative oxidoreductase C-terminal domain-containing protein n=1 Tax=uncultured Cyclobacterium sp. TaxID=453820 RepID=UPI0030EF3B61|tara:strand:+ start:118717 stop:120129 length:1413 start_codon:yes stop_codon:yes gene_type:complete